MISIVDKNGDGKISYSEFRVMLGRYIVYVPYTIGLTEDQKAIVSEFRVMLGRFILCLQCNLGLK